MGATTSDGGSKITSQGIVWWMLGISVTVIFSLSAAWVSHVDGSIQTLTDSDGTTAREISSIRESYERERTRIDYIQRTLDEVRADTNYIRSQYEKRGR